MIANVRIGCNQLSEKVSLPGGGLLRESEGPISALVLLSYKSRQALAQCRIVFLWGSLSMLSRMGLRPTNGDEKPVGWRGHLCLAAPALVRALVLRQVDKRRDESRRGRHKCPRHPGIDNLSNGLWRNSMVQPASPRAELKLIM